MSGINYSGSKKHYIYIIGDKIMEKVEKGTPNSIERTYKLKDGTEGKKVELVYNAWNGFITGLEYEDTEYGKKFKVIFDDAIFTIGVDTSFYKNLVSKLPNVDFTKKVTISVYKDFQPKGTDKKFSGITVKQGLDKITDYFRDENRKPTNGFPSGEGIDWKNERQVANYRYDVKEFLEKVVLNELVPRINSVETRLEDELPLPNEEQYVNDKEFDVITNDNGEQEVINIEEVPF